MLLFDYQQLSTSYLRWRVYYTRCCNCTPGSQMPRTCSLLHTLPSSTFSFAGQPWFRSTVQPVDAHILDQPLLSTIIDRLQPSMRLTLQKSCPPVPRVNSASVAGKATPTPLHSMVPDPQSPMMQEPNPDPSKLHPVRPQNLSDQPDLKIRI